ncbi:helix-turn-helix domain-containing protein [Crossiella sp. CA198]|uniref:helix-turn-helix domain-containing protein n=1 Tax=Crossiella sp. CA198 TaxID=3455607 RepID=UPI003F8D4F67
MSIEAMSWALNEAPIPSERRDASSLAIVLVGLANHADPDGRNAFPSVSTLVRYTRLSERSVQYALQALHKLELIKPSNPDIVAAYIKRADRRPKGWNLAIHSGAQPLRPADRNEVQTQGDGAQTTTSRGAEAAPEPSLNRPRNRPSRERAPQGARAAGLPPVCGQCDARPDDPVSARVVWLDEDYAHSAPCPRCASQRFGGER